MRAIAICLVFGVAGCGGGPGDAPVTIPVSGTVTLDGTPIESGEIIFEPLDGKGRSDAAKIEEGKYSADVAVGKKRVRITATRETGEVSTGANGEEIRVTEMYIPDAYGTNSNLEAVVESDAKVHDFDLASKP